MPASQVQVIPTGVPWETLGALPEMLQTAWGSLFKSLHLGKGERLLVRGGTMSVGLAAVAIAKTTEQSSPRITRRPDREQRLRSSGAGQVFADSGAIAEQVKEVFPSGATKSRRIGTTTLRDSLDCAKQRGIVCMTVTVGDKWSFDDFNPMDVISTSVCLTTYDGFHADTARRIGRAGRSTLRVQIGRVFKLDDIVEAHRCMEENKAGAKIVVLT